MTTPEEIVGETDLAVIGCGPTGIAALFQAGLEGIDAVGIEAGPAPLSSVRDYMNGLVLISRPRDYEVAGVPLDCKDPNELTREEVLHYSGRVINYGRLDIRCHEECLDLVPTDDAVLLQTARGTWRAKQVLVTGWYRKRPAPETFIHPESKVEVLDGLHDPISVAGKRTAIIGGGLSACEHAAAMMINGQSIKLFSRHRLPSQFRTQQFETLVRATRSVLVEGVGDLRLEDEGISYRLGGDGPLRAMSCDAVILCLGAEIDLRILTMLSRAGVVSKEEAAQVSACATPDTLIRRGQTIQEAIYSALGAWPDFWDRLFGGVRGIRLAGGALHIGGAHSGVRVSIHTASLAVKDIAGHPPPDSMRPPLSRALADWVATPPTETAFSLLGPLRPLRVASWTRTTFALQSWDIWEARPETPGASRSLYLLGPLPDDPRLVSIVRMADGRRSVEEIMGRMGTDHDPKEIAILLRYLWQNNILTWLPPPI